MNRMTTTATLIMVMTLVAAVQGADCPRFRGPAGDGQFSETGLLKSGRRWAQAAWPQGLAGYSFGKQNGTIYVTGWMSRILSLRLQPGWHAQ
jgi:hypothetical protein